MGESPVVARPDGRALSDPGRTWSDVFVSDDVERSRAHVAAHLSPHALEHRHGGKPPVFRHRHALCGSLALHELAYTMHGGEALIRVPELPGIFLFELNLGGRAQLQCGDDMVPFRGGELCVVNANRPHFKRWCSDGRQLFLRIPRARAETALAEMIRRPLAAPLQFDPLPRPVDAWTASLVDVVKAIHRDLERGGNGIATGHAANRAEQLLVELMVETIPNNYSHLIEGPPPPWPGHVKRAVDYIHTHADDAIRFEDIVAASGARPRSLQDGFRRALDCSPMAYLKRVRLDRARQAMLDGSAATVTDAAIASGFNHLSKFAKAYCECFGERPSETLARRS